MENLNTENSVGTFNFVGGETAALDEKPVASNDVKRTSTSPNVQPQITRDSAPFVVL